MLTKTSSVGAGPTKTLVLINTLALIVTTPNFISLSLFISGPNCRTAEELWWLRGDSGQSEEPPASHQPGVLGHFVERSSLSNEIGRGVKLCHLSFVQHQDPGVVHDGVEAMSDGEDGAVVKL